MPPKKNWSPALWEESADCWVWTDQKNADGYGLFGHTLAHRHALALSLGRPIKARHVAMHTCDNPPCVNPEHLREGTQAENLADMRAKGRAVRAVSPTHCPQGHEYTAENSYLYGKAVACRTCRTQRVREWRARQKEQA